MDTTTQDPVELTEDEQHNLRLIGFDVGAALMEAMGPKRVRRNIRIEELGIRVYTDLRWCSPPPLALG